MEQVDQMNLKRFYSNRFIGFQDLMRYRVRDILLVSSLYDTFILGEEGGLYELLLNEYMGLNLSHTPGITRVSSGREALELVNEDGRFDLVISTLHLRDMPAVELARRVRRGGIETPLVLLTYDNRELRELTDTPDAGYFDKVFMWQGNFRILLAIIKCIEDLRNLERDTGLAGVPVIILIEDDVKFYSSYLPIIYTQLLNHSQSVIEESVNLAHKLLRMRARPKILLCQTYEEAWELYETYHETILGVISDVRFPRGGHKDKHAGIEFVRNVKARHPDIPTLLQSTEPGLESAAHEVGASFLMKNSPRLLHELQQFMKQHFNFGDFVFRLPDGGEVGRARDLRELEERLHSIPDESLLFHAERNHFSNWLKARTEFFLAYKLRPRKVSDYPSVDALREALISYLREYHQAQHKDTIVDFDSATFDPNDDFTRIGGGSIGGKGRGLAFMNTLLNHSRVLDKFKGVDVSIPPTIIIDTDIFEQFMELNDLGEFAMESTDDDEIIRRFVAGAFPDRHVDELRTILRSVDCPLAVRSSSILEDSQYQPFAGVYDTFMLPNNHHDLERRLVALISAIKRVYASTFLSRAKAYIKATPYRLEEERMAVIIQKLVGRRHDNRFYPDISGVARSYNFYAVDPMTPEDGCASVALGLGVTVVEGGMTVNFCPRYPKKASQFSVVEQALTDTQREFYALEIPEPDAGHDHTREVTLARLGLDVAEEDGVLGPLGSVYSNENNAIYDGLSRAGVRLVTFAPILKYDLFPLAEIVGHILDLGRQGMASPVEIEFSVNLDTEPKEFRVLQLRPMVVSRERQNLDLTRVRQEELICRSSSVMGNGRVDGIHDLLVVDPDRFDRARTVEVAREVARLNVELMNEARPYILIGIGRWGSNDPFLGIPVQWDEIAGARAIVETGFRDMKVTPSQGAHFFQNLNAFRIGYFTVTASADGDFIDWDWLKERRAVKERAFTRLIRLDRPVVIKMNGHKGEGIITKPA